MKKIIALSTIFALGVSVILSLNALASGSLPGTGWWTSETVQNVGTAAASITVQAYDQSSVSTFSTPLSGVNQWWAVTYDPTAFTGMPAGFSGSGVAQSTQPIVALGTVTNQPVNGFGVAGGRARERYSGTNVPATTLYFPLAKNNWYGKTDMFYIQNAGGSGSAPAYATFSTFDGKTYTAVTPSIGPNQMVVISPSDAGMPSTGGVATYGNLGAVVITSTQNLAGMYLEYTVGQTVATTLNSTRGYSSADFDTTAYVPVVKNAWYGRYTGISPFNVGSVPITVTATFAGTPVAGVNNPCAGKTYVEQIAVQPQRAGNFLQKPGSTQLPLGCLASGTLTATGNFVALVNEENTSGATPAGIASVCTPKVTVTNKVAAPYFTDRRNGFYSGLQIQNVGTITATQVVGTFYCYGGSNGTTQFTAISNPQTIGPGGAFNFLKPNTMPAGTFTSGNPFASQNALCSAIVTSDQPIVANVNEDNQAVVNDANYEGFNLP